MTGRFRQALLEKGTMPKKFSVKSGDKSAAGGLTAKGVKRYRAANPGSKLKTAVTTKPSKLKKGSKAASRRKSFCARMGGMKKSHTSAKTANDPNSRINKALRKWNCSTDANPNALDRMSEIVLERFSALNRPLRKSRVKNLVKSRMKRFDRDMNNMSDADRRNRYEVEYTSDDSYRRGEPDYMRAEDFQGQQGKKDPIARNAQKLVKTIKKRGSRGQEDIALAKRASKEKKNIMQANRNFLKWGIDRNDQ